ncbi:MAG: hypothetical protein IJ861_07245 [Clostridia bacterium]|nr:hypothetical protein [Clostridia bacterium]
MKKTYVKPLSATLSALMLLSVVPTFHGLTSYAAASANVINLNDESVYQRTKEEIIENFNKSQPTDLSAPIYATIGNNTNGNYVPSTMTGETKQNVLRLSNYYRWLGGYSGFELLDDSSSTWDYDAKGSVLLSVSNFDHYPDQPSDMSSSFYNDAILGTSKSSIAKTNGATGQDSLLYTLRLWLNDDGYTVPGHRDMFFTRNGYLLGYGMYTDSSNVTSSCQTVVYKNIANPTGKSQIGNDEAAYTWPAPGYFPSDDLSVKAPWTITLNTDKVSYANLSDITVKITDNSTGKTETRTSSSGLYDTKYWGTILSFTAPSVTSDNYLDKSYTVSVSGLKDANSRSVDLEYSIDFFSYYSFENKSYIDKNIINKGEKVKLYSKADGYVGNISFEWYYKIKNTDSWVYLADVDSTNKILGLTMPSAGEYDFKVIAKDSAGNTDEKIFTLMVADELVNTSSISTAKIIAGESVLLTGSAAGGAGGYTYAYYYKKSDDKDWTKIGTEFGTASSTTFKPGTSGSYDIKITIKDSIGETAEKTFALTVTPALTNNTTVSKTTFNVGETVTVKGAAAGGSGTYTYEFYYKRSTATSWTKFGSAGAATFKPSSAGTFDIRVYAKDSTGASAVKNFTVTAKSALVNNSTVSKTSFNVGEAVTVKGAAAGGTVIYTYEFHYKRNTATSWTKFGSVASATFKPSSAGTFNIKVTAKDSAGNSSVKEFTLIANSAGLSNNTTVSKTSFTVGEAVTVKGAAAGGTGTYTYEFYYKKNTATSWTKFGSATSANFKPSSAGIFDIKVIAKDSAGNSSVKEFTLIANSAGLSNNTTVSKTNFTVGEAVTIKGAATGGTGTYTYEFYYKRSTATSWTKFGSATTATFKPSSTGTFDIRVYVKDSKGAFAVKDFTLTAKAG